MCQVSQSVLVVSSTAPATLQTNSAFGSFGFHDDHFCDYQRSSYSTAVREAAATVAKDGSIEDAGSSLPGLWGGDATALKEQMKGSLLCLKDGTYGVVPPNRSIVVLHGKYGEVSYLLYLDCIRPHVQIRIWCIHCI